MVDLSNDPYASPSPDTSQFVPRIKGTPLFTYLFLSDGKICLRVNLFPVNFSENAQVDQSNFRKRNERRGYIVSQPISSLFKLEILFRSQKLTMLQIGRATIKMIALRDISAEK